MKSQQQRAAETFDTYGDKYSQTVNDSIAFTGLDVDFFTRAKAKYIKKIAAAHFGEIRVLDVLDVGCGVGNFHDLLSSSVGTLSGVDVSKTSIELAKKLHPDVVYAVYDGSRLPFADHSFDLAITICVMHHVPPENWPAFVAEMYRVIKPGGLALVFEHNPLNPLTMRAVKSCPFDDDAVLLRSGKTKKLFSNAGFNNVRARFIISVPPSNDTLLAIDSMFAYLPLGAQYYVSAARR